MMEKINNFLYRNIWYLVLILAGILLILISCQQPTSPDIKQLTSQQPDQQYEWFEYNHQPSIVPVIPTAEDMFCQSKGYEYCCSLVVVHNQGRILCCKEKFITQE